MTRFLKGPFDVAAVLVLLSVPMAAQVTAQESGAQDTGSEGIATVARSGPLQIGGVEVSAGGPDRLIAASASGALLSGLEHATTRYVWPSLSADAVTGDETTADDDQESTGRVDAWGVRPNFPLAMGTLVLATTVTWAFNEYIKKGGISQVNPDTWWHNITQGFGWDDNEFLVNMLAHPYQGNISFNIARSNGFNYWESIASAALGSFQWECCGETHLMSGNDLVMTTVGGTFLGETFYRLTSAILDNEATGRERAWREAGALALNPARGVTRILTGRAFDQGTNPIDPLDHLGTRIFNVLNFGYRLVGEGERLDFSEDEAHFFVRMDLSFGRPFDMERNKPFDYFTFSAQLNFQDKQTLGLLQGRANLRSFELKRSDTSQHLFTILHYYDYINNNAYEFGGQSVGFAFLSNWIRSDRTRIVASADVHVMLMGAVNTEYAEFAEIPGVRERDREYDFGSGLGSWLNFYLLRDEHRIVDLSYRINWLHTLNGTNVGGQDTDHRIQQMTLGLTWPVTENWGVGAEGTIFLRKSYYEEVEFDDVVQRNPELRVMGTWRIGRRGVN